MQNIMWLCFTTVSMVLIRVTHAVMILITWDF